MQIFVLNTSKKSYLFEQFFVFSIYQRFLWSNDEYITVPVGNESFTGPNDVTALQIEKLSKLYNS